MISIHFFLENIKVPIFDQNSKFFVAKIRRKIQITIAPLFEFMFLIINDMITWI